MKNEQQNTPAPWLTPKDAAKFLGTTTRTLSTWRYRKEGPPYAKIGSSVRYNRSDLESYMNERIIKHDNID